MNVCDYSYWLSGLKEKKLCHICFFFFFSSFFYFFFIFFIPLPHLQWLCYQGSQAKGWSNHNFRAGLGRNNEVTKLQLPWQRHIQEHRMPLLKKIEETGPRIFPLSLSLPLSLPVFSYPSLSIFLSLSHPLPFHSVTFFYYYFLGSEEQREAVHFHSLCFPEPFVSEHIQNNKFTAECICIFLVFIFGGRSVSSHFNVAAPFL